MSVENFNTDKAIRFLKQRVAYPVLTSVRVDRESGTRGAVETKSWPNFHTDAKEQATCWEWIESRQGKANIYYSVNPTISPTATKAARDNIAQMVCFHVDLDPRAGEDQDEALSRLTKKLESYARPPTWIVASGGGVQGIWDLKPESYIQIGGDIPLAEDAKLYNIQLERDLEGDNCHNIDRIMRLPGTENCPDKKKRDKGRRYAPAFVVKKTDVLYDIADFTKATKVQDKTDTAESTGGQRNNIKVEVPTNINRIDDLFTNEHTAPLKDWVKRVIMDGRDPHGEKAWSSRSEAVFAIACEMVRYNVPDEVMYSVFTDPDFGISKSILEKKNVEREVTRVISRAHEYAIDPDLAEMNRKHAVVELGGAARVMTWQQSETEPDTLVPGYMSFDNFRNLRSNRKKRIEYIDKQGVEQKKTVPMGNWWLDHDNRRQFEGVRYMPYDDRDVVNGYMNLWTGFAVPALKGSNHESLLEHAKKNLCRGNEEHYDYLIKWCATVVQKRDKHTGVALVLRSEGEGTGKGTFLTAIGRLFGKHYRHITNPAHLIGKFNAHLQSCSFVFADESFFAGDRQHEGVLKTTITEDTIMIEPKGVDSTSVPNYINLGMASNSRFVVPASSTSRRYFVLDVATGNIQDTVFFGKILEDLNEHDGRSHLLHYLLSVDLTGFDVRKVPITEALLEQRALTRKGLDSLVETVAHNAVLPCAYFKSPDMAVTTGAKSNEGFWAFARQTFGDLRFWTPESMFNVLKVEWHCKRKSSGGQNYIVFPPIKELRRLFDARHGKQDWSGDPDKWQAVTTLGQDGARTGEIEQADIPF